MVLPCASVMVMVVLLKDEFTCATPDAGGFLAHSKAPFLRISTPPLCQRLHLKCTKGQSQMANRKPFAAPSSPFAQLLLLASDRLGRTLARARIGMGALTAHRQAAAMTQAAIAAKIHQPLDVDAGLATKIALDHVVAVDHFADLQDLLVAQLADATIQRDLHLLHDVPGALLADAMDVLQRDEDALVGRDIHAGNTGHVRLSCRRSAFEPDP